MALQPGSRFGVYRIEGSLGTGGMGEVYRAHDSKLNRDVALKVLPDSVSRDPDRIARFTREAQALASLNHPNIAHLYGLEESDGIHALVMELVDGSTLEELKRGRPNGTPWPEVAALGREIAETLASVHERGLVHRDLKPANIKVTSDGRVKILDFGLAKLTRPGSSGDAAESATHLEPQTQAGMLVGTIRYMSPEQAGGTQVDGRSDSWSLGVVLYELLTGQPPFDGETTAHQLVAILDKEPTPISDLGPGIPNEFSRIVKRALTKSPSDRYQSAREMAADLERLERRTSDASVRTLPAATPGWGRQPVQWALGVAIVALAIAGVVALRRSSPAIATTGAAAIESIAVLPFENNSPTADDQYLSDGISESLINALSALPNLSVKSRNASFRFRGKDAEPKAAGKRLGVGAVLSGHVRRVSGQLVIGVALVDVTRDVQVWGDQYVRPAGDVIAIQSEIARAVATQLRQRLSGDVEARLAHHVTENVAAYEAYLQGRFFEGKGDPASLVRATTENERAVALDPQFATAWAALGRAWLQRGILYEAPNQTMSRAREAANQALAVDPAQAEAHVVRGLVSLLYDWNWDEARRELMLSDELRPSVVDTFSCAAHLMQETGRASDAEREIRRALSADPLSVPMNTELGCNAFYQRQYDRAIAEFRHALELDDRNPIPYWGLGRAYAAKKEYRAALTELRRVDEMYGDSLPVVVAELGYVLGVSGDRAGAQRVLTRLDKASRQIFVDPYFRAIVYLGLGDRAAALHWLEEARNVRSSFLPSLPDDRKWDALRTDPRFVAVQAELKMGTPATPKPAGR